MYSSSPSECNTQKLQLHSCDLQDLASYFINVTKFTPIKIRYSLCLMHYFNMKKIKKFLACTCGGLNLRKNRLIFH